MATDIGLAQEKFPLKEVAPESGSTGSEEFYTASQTKLVLLRLLRHKLAIVGMVILVLFYLSAIFAPFLSAYDPQAFFDQYTYASPQSPRFWDEDVFSLRPFYYAMDRQRNPETLKMEYKLDKDKKLYVLFFTKGYSYKLLGLFETDIHLWAGQKD